LVVLAAAYCGFLPIKRQMEAPLDAETDTET
jgi:hypothetical protein